MWDYPTCGVCNVPRGKTSWRHGEGTELSLQQGCQNPNCLCKPHLFLTRGSKEQPWAILQGSLRWERKGTSCHIHPLAKVEKLSKGKWLPLEDEDLLQSKGCVHFSFLFSTTEKCQRANGSQELLPLLYLDKNVSPSTAFFLFYHQKEKSWNNLGCQLAPNDWEGREYFQLQGQILYVCSNQRQIREKPKALELGIKRVCAGLICSNSWGSCTFNILLGKSSIPKD